MAFNFSNIINLVSQFIPKRKIESAISNLAHKAIKKILTPPNPAAVSLINSFFEALHLPTDADRQKAILPLVHKSLVYNDKTGPVLDRTIRDYSYSRAVKNYGLYQFPVNITEVHQGNTFTVRAGSSAELDRTDKYFVAKRSGVAGLPAPVEVFFPSQGGAPSLINFGSL